MRDFSGAKTQYTYNAMKRLTNVQYADGTFKSFAYNSAGRMITARNENAENSFEYDLLGRLTGSQSSVSAIQGLKIFKTSYRYTSDKLAEELYYEDNSLVKSLAYQ
jgi:YD repeat-containing protein